MKWYSPQALAELANDGFLSIIRSTGKAAGYITFGTVKGIGVIGRSLTGKENNQSKGLSKAGSPLKPEEDKFPSLDLEDLLKQYPALNKIEAIKLRNVLDNLLHGFEGERLNAIKTLVDLRQFAEPFLVAFLPTITSPQVADIALEGLSQIDSPRLVDCIMKIFNSPEPEMRLIALRAAHRLASDQTQYFLERGLRDSSPRVKCRVLTYLSWGNSSWALAEIRRFCNDPDPKVKWAALEALLSVNASEAYEKLEQLMPSLDPAYRRRAVTLLKQRKVFKTKKNTPVDETPKDKGRSPQNLTTL